MLESSESSARENSSESSPTNTEKQARLKLAAAGVPVVALLAVLAIWLPEWRGTESPGGRNTQIEVGTKEATTAPTRRESEAQVASEEGSENAVQGTVRWVRTISSIPDKDFELAAAHDQALRDSCEALPAGDAVLLDGFQPHLTKHDDREYSEAVSALSTRRPIFTVGLDMFSIDQKNLPTLSGRSILSYLQSNYICLQVRIQKKAGSEDLFLHHRPIACVAKFKGTQLTQDLTAGMTSSLDNYRSLGMYLPKNQRPTPSNLRTLVLIHKGEGLDKEEKAFDKYELVFIRARQDRSDSEKLELHAFTTTDNRTMLHYLNCDEHPDDNDDCSIKTMIHFTKYSHAGLYPSESETRDTQFNDRSEYNMAALESYAEAQGWEDGPLKHLNQVLDDLIDGKVPVSPRGSP
ncbi:hypothetical protein [Adhaeretor mobilis]|uniref:Uncharacterized protein n=1 Tax=Adhaeretor mobilis TaxID=1930276 RepID=A0A517MZA1_9BACT|nr:hypothetical protein [Adhaeretor mobilis]QDT00212.1 hypothetical protein HG15A2_35470 [Adhaeretor mobilis]